MYNKNAVNVRINCMLQWYSRQVTPFWHTGKGQGDRNDTKCHTGGEKGVREERMCHFSFMNCSAMKDMS